MNPDWGMQSAPAEECSSRTDVPNHWWRTESHERIEAAHGMAVLCEADELDS